MRKNIFGTEFLRLRRLIFQIFGGKKFRKTRQSFAETLKMARNRRCAHHAIACAHSFVVCCFSKCAAACLQPIFCVCRADFSNFRRRKRCKFPRKIRRSRVFGVAHRNKSHLETLHTFCGVCAAFKNAQKIFLEPIFCVCGVDFSNFRREKRGNLPRKF